MSTKFPLVFGIRVCRRTGGHFLSARYDKRRTAVFFNGQLSYPVEKLFFFSLSFSGHASKISHARSPSSLLGYRKSGLVAVYRRKNRLSRRCYPSLLSAVSIWRPCAERRRLTVASLPQVYRSPHAKFSAKPLITNTNEVCFFFFLYDRVRSISWPLPGGATRFSILYRSETI